MAYSAMTAGFIDVTKTNGSIWGRGKHIRILEQKHCVDFYHYMTVVCRHCQHTSQYNQLGKAHVPHYMTPLKENSSEQWTFGLIKHRYIVNRSLRFVFMIIECTEFYL